MHAGDTLVRIHSSVMEAQLGQAEAMREVAAAQNKKVDAGTRMQIVNAAADLLRQAEAALTIAKKTYERMERLYAEALAPSHVSPCPWRGRQAVPRGH